MVCRFMHFGRRNFCVHARFCKQVSSASRITLPQSSLYTSLSTRFPEACFTETYVSSVRSKSGILTVHAPSWVEHAFSLPPSDPRAQPWLVTPS